MVAKQVVHDLVQLIGLSFEMNDRSVQCLKKESAKCDDPTLTIMTEGYDGWKEEYQKIMGGYAREMRQIEK